MKTVPSKQNQVSVWMAQPSCLARLLSDCPFFPEYLFLIIYFFFSLFFFMLG